MLYFNKKTFTEEKERQSFFAASTEEKEVKIFSGFLIGTKRLFCVLSPANKLIL
jgi:hypothetical protein